MSKAQLMAGYSFAELNEPAVESSFQQALNSLHAQQNRFFARLLIVQWFATILLAVIISPLAWQGSVAGPNVHLLAALLLGGAISLYPAWLGWKQFAQPHTRYLISVAQLLMSALLIHLTGGRIETHFHIFASLALIAFYRDIRLLVTAALVVYVDHLVRGIFWPESVYGVLNASPWRSLEHAFWVLLEVTVLSLAIRRSLLEMRVVACRQTSLEDTNVEMEQTVAERNEELAASEERFRTLFQESPLGLYRATPAGELLFANKAMLQLLSCASLMELQAEPAWLQKLDRECDRGELFRQLGQTKGNHSRDAIWHHPDGTRIFVRESFKVVTDASGLVLYVDGIVEDITERRQLEERYFQAQKVQAIGQLAGGVAHDFNNIMTAILCSSEGLLLDSQLTEEDRQTVAGIKQSSLRAASLTQQLLAFSRKQTLQPVMLSLNDIVLDLDKMLRRLLGENIEIRTSLAPRLTRVKADPGQIQQVLMNLVVNARDAMPTGGKLSLETRDIDIDASFVRLHPELTPGRYVQLSVSDTGKGMTAEVKARLFEPFFTTKGVGEGSGLGLATCHGIVKQSGGYIAVYSELGLGTTVKVYLPGSIEASTVTAPPKNASVLQGGTETILLVEDEPMVRKLSRKALLSLGYQVLEAANGAEAMRLWRELKEERVDLVISDVIMPQVGGVDLARWIRVQDPAALVLFTSGYTFDALENTELQTGQNRFLHKPYTIPQLAGKVRELLDAQ